MKIKGYMHLDSKDPLDAFVVVSGRPILLITEQLEPTLNRYVGDFRPLFGGNILYETKDDYRQWYELSDGEVKPSKQGIDQVVKTLEMLYSFNHIGESIPDEVLICTYGSEEFHEAWSPLLEKIHSLNPKKSENKLSHRW